MRTLIGALCLLAVVGCDRDRGPRNVLLISVDTLNRDAVRAYVPDLPPQPRLDALAAESLVFERATATSSWTLPSHGSMLTGLYPSRLGLTHLRTALPFDVPTLAERLKEEGFETIGFADGALMQAHYGHGRGFDVYDEERAEGFQLRGPLPRGGARDPDSARGLFDRSIAYLRQRASDDPPFFLFAHTYAVHDYFLRVGPADASPAIECLVGERACDPDTWESFRQGYAAGVAHLDRRLGDLLQTLRDTGHADDTLVLLVSDHGEGFDPDAVRIHHGGRLHEDQLRIPALLRVPGRDGGRTPTPFSLVDVVPTILDLLQLEIPAGLDGVPALSGPARDPSRVVFGFEHAYRWIDGKRVYEPHNSPHHVAAIRGDDWHIASVDGDARYRMADDPRQANNRIETLTTDDALRKRAREAVLWTAPGQEKELEGEELIQHLRSLGYVD